MARKSTCKIGKWQSAPGVSVKTQWGPFPHCNALWIKMLHLACIQTSFTFFLIGFIHGSTTKLNLHWTFLCQIWGCHLWHFTATAATKLKHFWVIWSNFLTSKCHVQWKLKRVRKEIFLVWSVGSMWSERGWQEPESSIFGQIYQIREVIKKKMTFLVVFYY